GAGPADRSEPHPHTSPYTPTLRYGRVWAEDQRGVVKRIRMSAELIKGAVDALPSGQWDDDAAAEAVRAYLASLGQDHDDNPDPGAIWERLRATIHRSVSSRAFRTAVRTDPAGPGRSGRTAGRAQQAPGRARRPKRRLTP